MSEADAWNQHLERLRAKAHFAAREVARDARARGVHDAETINKLIKADPVFAEAFDLWFSTSLLEPEFRPLMRKSIL